MKPLKNYIKEKLQLVGVKNLYDFEQAEKTTLLANLDAAEFFGGVGTLTRSEETGFSETLENSTGDEDAVFHDRKQKIGNSVNQQLRLFMKKETADARLNKFYSLIPNEDARAGQIARVIEYEKVTIDGQETDQEVYYDILDLKVNEGKEYEANRSRPKIVEVIMTFSIQYGIFQSREGVTVEDFPVDIEISEE